MSEDTTAIWTPGSARNLSAKAGRLATSAVSAGAIDGESSTTNTTSTPARTVHWNVLVKVFPDPTSRTKPPSNLDPEPPQAGGATITVSAATQSHLVAMARMIV